MGPENRGEFILDADDVESRMKGIQQHVTNMEQSIEKTLLYWLSQRDNSLAEQTDMPITASRLENIVNELVQAGAGTVCCRQSGQEVQHEQLILEDDDRKPGNNYDRLVCPHGHILLAIDTGHFSVIPNY